jgi:hypothetical protein
MICAIVGKKAIIPFELLNIPTGQIMRRQVPPEKTKDVLDFATKKPAERLQSIVNGLQVRRDSISAYIAWKLVSRTNFSKVLAYGQSDYVRQFGLNVDSPSSLPSCSPSSSSNPSLQRPVLFDSQPEFSNLPLSPMVKVPTNPPSSPETDRGTWSERNSSKQLRSKDGSLLFTRGSRGLMMVLVTI